MMELLPLRCPACGENLTGLNNDVVFQCMRCDDAFELSGKRFVRHELVWAEPKVERPESLIRLPFWKFDVDYRLEGEPDSRLRRLESVPKIDPIYVAAFFQRDIFYFGDIGLIYTQANVSYETTEKRRTLLGASRNAREGSVYCRLFILQILDRRIDVTGIEAQVEITGVQLLGIPFYDLGEKIVDDLLGIEIGAVCLDDLNEIRKVCREDSLSGK